MHRSASHGPSDGKCRGFAIGFCASAALVLALALVSAAAAVSPREVYDSDAAPDWSRQINGSGISYDAAYAVVADSAGAWVAGYVSDAAGSVDATLQRYSTTGAAKWASPRRYDGPAHKNDYIRALARGPGGTVYGAGWTQAANNRFNILVIKWSRSGSRLWARAYDGPAHGDDLAAALGVDRDGNVIVAGSCTGSHGLDYTVVKWSSAGVLQWVRRYDGSAHQHDQANDILVTRDGTCYVTGTIVVAATPTVKQAARTVKFSATGRKLWGRIYLGHDGRGASALAIAARPAGGVYIAGCSRDAVTADDAMVVRYSATGVSLRLSQAHPAGDDTFEDIAVAANRHIVAVGYATVAGSADGLQVEWNSETTGGGISLEAGGFYDGFIAITADPYGGVYYTGYRGESAGVSRILTIRKSTVAAHSGFRSLWGPALGTDVPAAIASYGTSVYVVGTTNTVAEGVNQVILAYIY